MTIPACARRVSATACYVGHPAAPRLAALVPTSTSRRSPRVMRRAIADVTRERKHPCHSVARRGASVRSQASAPGVPEDFRQRGNMP